MGGGRHAKTHLKQENYDSSSVNYSARARNLTKSELGSVIFGCKRHTMDECLTRKLFGLPSSHYSYVKKVATGLPLFLFNYSNRTLHGVFEAVGPGQLNIDPYAWTSGEGTQKTTYPAQVRVSVRRMYNPLREDEFEPIIAHNYYEKQLFWFELDKEQTRNLIQLFSSAATMPKKVPRPPAVTVCHALPASVVVKPVGNPVLDEVVDRVDQLSLASKMSDSIWKENGNKKWSDLFKS